VGRVAVAPHHQSPAAAQASGRVAAAALAAPAAVTEVPSPPIGAGPPLATRRAGPPGARYGETMRCPFCAADDDKVVDSRPADDGAAVRRRRECLGCGHRYTTYERVDEVPLVVVKRSGAREPFDAEKVRSGIQHAVAGSAIDPAAVDALTVEIEEQLRALGPDVPSTAIGLAVLARSRLVHALRVGLQGLRRRRRLRARARRAAEADRPEGPGAQRSTVLLRARGDSAETLAMTSV
jgi:transcriptional repressor NrdR